MNKAWHKLSVDKCFSLLEVGVDGLSEDEIRARIKQYGKNVFPKGKSDGFIKVALRQFTSPLMFILVIAAVASVVIGEIGDAIVIAIAVIINAIVGFVQEWKAEKAVKALKTYEIARVKVRRNGVLLEIDPRELVPGDMVLLEEGSRVSADIRLTSVIDLQVDESLLTGESYPVDKNTDKLKDGSAIGDRVNMAYLGTLVSRGRGEGIVVATGVETQLGDIAKLVTQLDDESTPLQRQVKRFSWQLGVLFSVVIAVMFVYGVIVGMSFKDMFGMSIALAVSAIPEGLLIAMTVVLALGMQKMLKRKALVRKLVAAETLGSVSVICTDKTGTLTKGSMSVVRVVTNNHNLEMHGTMPDEVNNMLMLSALNNDSEVTDKRRIGHPTELALVDAAISVGFNVSEIRKKNERIGEKPFSTERKYMVTVNSMEAGKVVIVKGAPERVFAMCNMGAEDLDRLKGVVNNMASDGLRVLAVAKKITDDFDLNKTPAGLEFVGLIGLRDPLRETTVTTIKELKSAGIRIVVITGDHPDTALAIARESGIAKKNGGVVVTGIELDILSDEELKERIATIDVFARVSPRHKVRIVDAWQSKEMVVAMIGDGVNDAAAMKASDIGVALGSGTDVAQQTSDMVLLNDDLSSITSAVREGRVIFDNIRKVIVYLMADSFSEIVLIAGALMLGLPLPIIAVQILWINIVADGFPSLALTAEPGESDTMEQSPRPKNEPVVNNEMKMLIFFIGIVTDIGLLAMFIFLLSSGYNLEHLRTLMFTALALDSLFYVYAVRSLRHSIFRVHPFSNHWLNVAILVGVLVQVAVVYTPFLQPLFSTIGLNALDWSILIGLSLIKLVLIEASKEIYIAVKNRKYATQN